MLETSLPYILTATLFLVAGFVLGHYVAKQRMQGIQAGWLEKERHWQSDRSELKEQFQQVVAEKSQLLEDKLELAQQVAVQNVNIDNLEYKNREQQKEVAELQQKFSKEFENLANKILEEKSTKFTQQNQQNIKTLLEPLQEKIQLFEKKVAESQKENIGIHAALREQLLQLKDQNLKITQEAENLTKALKGDSKMQGNWGELVLERVLEKSGLEKGREYEVQQLFTGEDGSRQLPDVIINLPNNKKMVVDAKVSLTDYERYANAEEADRGTHLKAHLNSIKRHVAQLSSKKYEDLYQMESPDFVLLFIPIEPAFAIALAEDNSLYTQAFEKNIVIVTPTTLLATLRTIDTMWNNEKQQRNAIEIARLAGSLHDKFAGFMEDMLKVEKKMEDAQKEHQQALKKLGTGRGNILATTQKLKDMGAKAKKTVPSITHQATASEVETTNTHN